MRILVDTHVVLWAAVDDDRLSGAHRALYTDPSNALVVSVASLWEIAIKVGLGKLPLPVPPADFFAREVASRGYEVLDIRRPHAERVGLLRYPPGGHRDPFDRMLVAQSLVEGLPLMSADMRLRDYVDQGVLLV
ncbi:MAG: type II toxin-antitoxin system VapC family toxin [Myxococcales bacterium]|nr:type II toxin-antitoxin system VapC family toxin [Myxococcales bacterium]